MVLTEWDERGSYKVLECDCCGESVDTLYDAGDKQLCRECMLKENQSEFLGLYWGEIVEQYGDDYLEGFEEVEVD